MLYAEVIYVKQLISRCPGCQGTLRISTLQCPDCGMELKNDFELSKFDQLDSEQYKFLLSFLKGRGSLKEVQADLQMSYPTAKKKLDELLAALNLSEEKEEDRSKKIDMGDMSVDYTSRKASEIIKAKIKENDGHATVYTVRGLACEIYANPDGETFTSDKLPIKPPYEYSVFDVIVNLLLERGGRARKGNGRNYRLGDSGCEETTVVGAIAKYRGRKVGDSVYDPVFVMAAVLEWAGIVENVRGELILTEEYRKLL